MSWERLDPDALVPYEIEGISETEFRASCKRCPWSLLRPSYVSARTATMYHYYTCPGRFELPEVPE